IEKMSAIGDFLRCRSVAGRSTPDCGSDVGVSKLHSVIATDSHRLRGEACLVQHRIHKVSRAVAGKRTASAIRSMSSWSQSQDENPRIPVAESRHRLGPILPIHVGPPLSAPNLFAVSDETRTEGATDDSVVQFSN